MEIKINIEKKHLYVIAILCIITMSIVFAIGNPTYYHTLSEIYTSSNGVSIDANNNGKVDSLDVEGAITSDNKLVCLADGTNCQASVSKWTGTGDIYYSGGKVGIGTTAPNKALQVQGDISASGTICDGQNRCIGNIVSKWEGTSDISYTGGKVGIGTSTPSEKLHVDGTMKATEVCIGNDCKSAWPGGSKCVFASSDNLKDNQEIEISLMSGNTNVCTGLHGCQIMAWSVYDSDTSSPDETNKIRYMFYVQNENYWVLEGNGVSERKGKNGDGVQDNIIPKLGDNTNCDIYDDKADEEDPDQFFMIDNDGNERCFVSICARG